MHGNAEALFIAGGEFGKQPDRIVHADPEQSLDVVVDASVLFYFDRFATDLPRNSAGPDAAMLAPWAVKKRRGFRYRQQ